MTIRTGVPIPSLCIAAAIVLAAAILPGAVAQRSAGGPVAVVNISQVLAGLNERADAEAKLRAKAEEIQAEGTARQETVRKLQVEYEAMTDPAARLAAEERIDPAVIQFRAWQELMRHELDIDRALMLERLYYDIMAAVADVANDAGVDLVLIHDNAGEIKKTQQQGAPPLEEQVLQQISQRRIAFAAPRIDRTRDVINQMNLKYKP